MRPERSEVVLNETHLCGSTVRPERSEVVLNETHLCGSTVRPEQKSGEWLVASGEETQIPSALSLSMDSTKRHETNNTTHKQQAIQHKPIFLATRHSPLVPVRIKAQGGFAIVAAIFLIVVLALLATGMVQIASTSHTSLTQEYTSARAYLAARSGLQWGMYQAIYAGGGNSTITFSDAALAGTQASLTSVSTTVDGDTFFTINADGSYGVNTDAEYSLRQLRLRFNP